MRTLSLVFAISLLSACAGLSTKAPQTLNLTGSWRLNPALSDIPAISAKRNTASRSQNPGQRKGGMRGGATGGGGKGGQQGRGGRGKSPGSSNRQKQGGQTGVLSMRKMMMALKADTLEIEQNSDSTGIQFSSPQDQGYRDLFWGKKKKGDLKTESGWDETMFVVKMNDGRMNLTENYIISEDGQQLTVFIEMSGGREGSRKARKVFDRAS